MIPIISFIGCSSSGKTTLLEKVVAELNRRSIRVAVIKHSPHNDLEFDKNGKDSQRYVTAGAEAVIVSGPQEIAFMQRTDHDLAPDEITSLINADIDLVLTEGYKYAATAKIAVYRKELNSELPVEPGQLLAIITDRPFDIQVPQFDIFEGNIVEIANFIENWLLYQTEQIESADDNESSEITPLVQAIATGKLEVLISSGDDK